MHPDEEKGPGREIRVEGAGLLLLGVALAAVVVGAFLLGRWVGSNSPSAEPRATLSTASAEESTPASTSSSYFDAPAGGQKALEPQREVAAPPAAPPQVQATPSPGSYFVQVFAGRDRHAAETLVESLAGRGYPVRLDTHREGRDTLFKVRVGGYPTQTEAQGTAARLRQEGETGAWVTEVR